MSEQSWLTFCPFATRIPADRVDYELWALVSLAPIIWIIAHGGATLAKRDLHQCFALVGMVFTAGCIKLIKHAWKQPRPALNCHHLDTCNTYGMPSAHTQLAFFQCTWALLVAQRLGRTRAPAAAIDTLLLAAGVPLATLVGASRVVLGYHTLEQVLVGAVAGVATAALWFLVFGAVVQPLFKSVGSGALRWLCDALGLHDSLTRAAAPSKRRE